MAASLVFRRLKTLNIKQFTLWLGYKLQVFLGIYLICLFQNSQFPEGMVFIPLCLPENIINP